VFVPCQDTPGETRPCCRGLGEVGHADQTLPGARAPVAPTAFDLPKRVGSQVTLAAMGADDYRHVLDDEQSSALTVASGNALGACALNHRHRKSC